MADLIELNAVVPTFRRGPITKIVNEQVGFGPDDGWVELSGFNNNGSWIQVSQWLGNQRKLFARFQTVDIPQG
ncbi:MAG: hypothetical protein V3W28_06680, partial [Thermoplasmata archaeon]